MYKGEFKLVFLQKFLTVYVNLIIQNSKKFYLVSAKLKKKSSDKSFQDLEESRNAFQVLNS